MRKMFALTLLLMPSAALAEVKSSSPNGFEVETRSVVAAAPAETWAALVRVQDWWSDDHTYSGSAANLRLDPRAGGCFCETVPQDGGSIEHLRIVYARPGKTLRLHGGLGPLQAQGVAGTFTWALKAVPGGTEVTQTYIIGGNLRGGGEALAPAVDKMLAEQLGRLKAHLAR